MTAAEMAAAAETPRRARSVLTPEVIAVVTVGLALGALYVATTDRVVTRLDNAIAESAADRRAFLERADADRRAFQAEAASERRAFQEQAAADRRAFQSGMDEFRKRMDEFRRDMQGLGQRQSHLEGQRQGAAER